MALSTRRHAHVTGHLGVSINILVSFNMIDTDASIARIRIGKEDWIWGFRGFNF